MPYANNKGADQPAHPRSLTSAFVVRYLDSIIPLLATHVCISKHLRPYLVSEAEYAGLSLNRSHAQKAGFFVTRLILCADEAFHVESNLVPCSHGAAVFLFCFLFFLFCFFVVVVLFFCCCCFFFFFVFVFLVLFSIVIISFWDERPSLSAPCVFVCFS